MNDYKAIYEAITKDPRYQQNLDWGEPRPGHPEGTVRAHVVEVDQNLDALRAKVSEDDYWRLKVLVHTHDTFKKDAERGVPITDPKSHASLARTFLAEFCDDTNMQAIVQYHDEPFALWRQFEAKGKCNQERFAALIANIKDWNLFLAFNIIDGCTEGKDRDTLHWLFQQVSGKVQSQFTETDIL